MTIIDLFYSCDAECTPPKMLKVTLNTYGDTYKFRADFKFYWDAVHISFTSRRILSSTFLVVYCTFEVNQQIKYICVKYSFNQVNPLELI